MSEKDKPQPTPLRSVRKVPPPITHLSGTGGWVPPVPKPTQMPLDWPVYFPPTLIPTTTVIVGEALTRFPIQPQTLQLCKAVVGALTPQFCAEARKDKRQHVALYWMSDLLDSLLNANCDSRHEKHALEEQVKRSDEWLNLARELTRPPEENTTNAAISNGTNRRAAVDAYIDEVFQKKRRRIKRTDIWREAGYKSRTEFERWERNDCKNPNRTAHEHFTRILTEKPHLK